MSHLTIAWIIVGLGVGAYAVGKFVLAGKTAKLDDRLMALQRQELDLMRQELEQARK